MYDEQMSERTAKKESNGDRQVGSLGGPESRGGRQNGRGSSRAGAHSFFTTFFGFAASVGVMMTRYAANAKQTKGSALQVRWLGGLITPRMARARGRRLTTARALEEGGTAAS